MKGGKDNQSSNSKQLKLTQFLIKRGVVRNNQSVVRLVHKQNNQIKHHKQSQSPLRSHTQSLHSVSPMHRIERQQTKPKDKQDERLINVLFYLNKISSRPNGEFINQIHSQWYNNYERLQRDHSFIQWIFPNSFQSRFNMHAKPLSPQQAQQFKKTPQILERYIKSYNMMLAFYGMKIKDKQTGELARSRNPHYQQRFQKTLISSFHNHMRITRILCSLTQLGFTRYASQLCKFLKHQIQHEEGKLQILRKYNVYKDWKPYQNGVENQKNTNVYMAKINRRIKHYQNTLKDSPKEIPKNQLQNLLKILTNKDNSQKLQKGEQQDINKQT